MAVRGNSPSYRHRSRSRLVESHDRYAIIDEVPKQVQLACCLDGTRVFGRLASSETTSSTSPHVPTQPMPMCANHPFAWSLVQKRPDSPTQTRSSLSAVQHCHPQSVAVPNSPALLFVAFIPLPSFLCLHLPARHLPAFLAPRFPDLDVPATTGLRAHGAMTSRHHWPFCPSRDDVPATIGLYAHSAMTFPPPLGFMPMGR